ncbi:MAG TPA: adenosine kinase [Acidimicrobiales bacterium]|jgi:sugar/nucleoside kinase (ribokinase family)|nr:adenosine kinase [Acidimicrobiales bacterium]
MSDQSPDLAVVTVGNAIVDVLIQATDDFLAEHELVKGSMDLVDLERSAALYAASGPGIEISGGSAGNTAAGIASLGGTVGFIGKVRDDQLGAVYSHDMAAAGVTTSVATAPDAAHGGTDDPSTGRCLVLITPDAQRTMNTYLGIAGQLTPDDVDPAFVARGAVTYVEGYLWDAPHAKDAVVKAMDAARGAGREVAFTLSDGFCVDRHRAEFLDLIGQRIDIVFANEDEICSLFEVDDFDTARKAAAALDGKTWVLTRSEKGSVVASGDSTVAVPAAPVDRVVDTTGAGDLFAAGYLHGHVLGLSPERCARIGSVAAAEVISHVGARPQTPLATLAADLLA